MFSKLPTATNEPMSRLGTIYYLFSPQAKGLCLRMYVGLSQRSRTWTTSVAPFSAIHRNTPTDPLVGNRSTKFHVKRGQRYLAMSP